VKCAGIAPALLLAATTRMPVFTSSSRIGAQEATSAVRLPDVLFAANSSRVNNCGKRTLLEDLRSHFERDPAGTVVLVGHIARDETVGGLARQRVRNAAALITTGKGVCLSIPADRVLLSAPGVVQNGVEYRPNFCAALPSLTYPDASEVIPERVGQTIDANDRMAEYRRVEVWFVPRGGQLPDSAVRCRTAASMNVGALGCPR
jgi:hypothetical protein